MIIINNPLSHNITYSIIPINISIIMFSSIFSLFSSTPNKPTVDVVAPPSLPQNADEPKMPPFMAIDIAVEDGNLTEAIKIHQDTGAKPSLYAKQMALVNGNYKTNLWVDGIGTRNNTGIAVVHRNYSKGKGMTWHESIPEQFRYIE